MPDSDVDLCNVALARIGEKDFIDDLDEDSTAAQVASVVYPLARDSVLEAFSWRFAQKRAVLAVLDGVERSGWSLVYSLPTDCLVPRYLYPGTRNPSARERVPFEIELNDAGDAEVLVTDQVAAELIYTSRFEMVRRFSPLFCDALSWKLAQEFALAIPIKPALAQVMEVKFKAALASAIASELRKAQEDAVPYSEFSRIR